MKSSSPLNQIAEKRRDKNKNEIKSYKIKTHVKLIEDKATHYTTNI